MIVDSLKNAALYYSVCPRMQRAFELLATLDLESLPEGKIKLDGDDIVLNIVERDLKTTENAKLEVHDNFADVQIVIAGDDEGFGWRERCTLNEPTAEFDTVKDIQFFTDSYQFVYTLSKGQFTIVMPEDAHAPLIGDGRVKKGVLKVRI